MLKEHIGDASALEIIRSNQMFEPRLGAWLYENVPDVDYYSIFHFFRWGDLMDYVATHNLFFTDTAKQGSLGIMMFFITNGKKNVGYAVNAQTPPFVLVIEKGQLQ